MTEYAITYSFDTLYITVYISVGGVYYRIPYTGDISYGTIGIGYMSYNSDWRLL